MNKKRLTTRLFAIMLAAVIAFTAMPALSGESIETYAATSSSSTQMNYHKWLDSLKVMAHKVQDDKFKFDRFGCPKGSYSKARLLSGSKRVCNCSDYISWSMQRIGLLPAGRRFYAKGQTVLGSGRNTIKGEKFQIIKISGRPRASTLVKKGILKPGDIISQADGSGHHMQVYAGKNSKGKIKWYAIGKRYQVGKGGYYVASRILTTENDKRAHHNNPQVAMIIRIRNLSYQDYFKVSTSVTGGTIYATKDVYWGKNRTVKYSPKAGYKLKAVYVDGKSVSITKYATSYKFTNVKKAHTIKVVFVKKTFSVNVEATEGGTVVAPETVTYGEDGLLEITPNEGYKLESVVINDAVVDLNPETNENVVIEDGIYKVTMPLVKGIRNVIVAFVQNDDAEEPATPSSEEPPTAPSTEPSAEPSTTPSTVPSTTPSAVPGQDPATTV